MTAPNVSVNFTATGLEGVRRGIQLVKDDAGETGEKWGMASRRISYGLEEAARSGNLAGRSLREIIASGAEIALGFGSGGPIVAALAVTGVAIYEHITGKMKEAEEEAKKVAIAIGGLANTGDLGKLRGQANTALYGSPYDRDGKLVGSSSRVHGAFKGSLADMEAEYAELQSKLPRGAQYATGEIAKRWNELVPQLNKARDAFRQLQEAANNVASQPAGNSGMLSTLVSTAKAPHVLTDAEKEKQWRLWMADQPFLNDVRERQEAGERAALGRVSFSAYGGNLPGLKPVKITEHSTDSASKDFKERAKQLGNDFATTLADSIEAGVTKAFTKGTNIGGIFAAIGQTALAGLGSIAVQIGKTALTQFAFIKSIAEGLANLNPGLGIAAAIGLIAFGSALGGAGSRIGSSAAGGGGYGSSYAAGSGYGSSIIDRGSIDPTRGGGVSPRSGNNYSFNIIGPNDPVAQRQILALIDQAEGRGRA